MSILEAKKISKIYNEGTDVACIALNSVSLNVEEGDFIVIMGPSGSGKSTLLNNISSLDTPSRGTVHVLQESTLTITETKMAQYRNEYFGYIFQDFNLVEALTIYENVALPLLVRKKDSKEEIKAKVEANLKRMGIDQCANKLPKQCSVGQRQRAAICRALVNQPKLIVADEPTGNLDSKNSHDFLQILYDLNKTDNVSIIMVTHDPSIASYSKKVLYIKDGQIEKSIERGDMDQDEYYHKIVDMNMNA